MSQYSLHKEDDFNFCNGFTELFKFQISCIPTPSHQKEKFDSRQKSEKYTAQIEKVSFKYSIPVDNCKGSRQRVKDG